jgi:hypothetical protein
VELAADLDIQRHSLWAPHQFSGAPDFRWRHPRRPVTGDNELVRTTLEAQLTVKAAGQLTLAGKGRSGLRLAMLVGGALFCCFLWTGAAAAAEPTVPSISCPTAYAVQGTHPRIPARIAVRGDPQSVRGLVAYSDAYAHLVGPAGMQCRAIAAVDGSQGITVWPQGQREPRSHSDGQGLSLEVVPACVGCMYSLVCRLDQSLANQIFPGYPVPCGHAPAKEHIERRGSLVIFTDPPYVAGDASPSGGPYSAYGAVGWTRRQGAFAASCTLPESQRSVCTTSLNDAITTLH